MTMCEECQTRLPSGAVIACQALTGREGAHDNVQGMPVQATSRCSDSVSSAECGSEGARWRCSSAVESTDCGRGGARCLVVLWCSVILQQHAGLPTVYTDCVLLLCGELGVSESEGDCNK